MVSSSSSSHHHHHHHHHAEDANNDDIPTNKDLEQLFIEIKQVIEILREVFPASLYAKQFLSLWKWLGKLQVGR